MRFFWYIGVSLALVICRTTLLPYMPAMANFFDPLLCLVVYLAVFRPLSESIPLLAFLGILMDTLSGGPFGLYLTSYVWLFIGVRLAAAFIRVESAILLVLMMAGGVVLQNVVFLAAASAFHLTRIGPGDMLRVFTEQVGWVFLAGPPLAVLMRSVERGAAPGGRRQAPAE
ncbi:MAG: hypothetical protein MUF46_07390 [Desulfobacterales bacterium]|jgi:rod shape-determining protein MreD|nr:hypothetical protein [Desulfobacterales bacterium]